jgi:hypothetical protein
MVNNTKVIFIFELIFKFYLFDFLNISYITIYMFKSLNILRIFKYLSIL